MPVQTRTQTYRHFQDLALASVGSPPREEREVTNSPSRSPKLQPLAQKRVDPEESMDSADPEKLTRHPMKNTKDS